MPQQQKNIPYWSMDFETTTTADDCRVWVYGACSIQNPDIFVWGKTIDDFVQFLWNSGNMIGFFHNLAFDGSFIVDWLLHNGYKWVKDDPEPGQFTTLISNMGKWYQLSIRWANGVMTELRDSLKKLPMSVRAIAQTFELDEGKGDIDYHLPRPAGYEPTRDELDYLRRDVQIVAYAIRQQLQEGMTKLTVGSDSLAQYKDMTGKKIFDKYFPILNEDIDADIRKAYRGGFTYADPRFTRTRQGAGKVYDVNSLYPYIMYDRLLPYGTPSFFEGEPPKDGLWISSVMMTAKLKPGHIPCIQVKDSPALAATEYQRNITEPVGLYMTSVDWELWNRHYDITVLGWGGGWKFAGRRGFFKDYIEKWMRVKAESTGGMRAIAKLHLNSLYGKFATNPNVTGKVPVLVDGAVKLVMGEPETRNPVYTAMGVFITAYARELTISAAQENYDVFAYADTDSLHLLTEVEPENLRIHRSDLGAWKHEYDFTDSLYMRAKAYAEVKVNGETEIHIAGVPESITSKLGIDDLVSGRKFSGKLSPSRVPGGIVLEDVGFTLTY